MNIDKLQLMCRNYDNALKRLEEVLEADYYLQLADLAPKISKAVE